MNLQSKFGYCMTNQTLNNSLHFVNKRDGITDRWTDGRKIQTLDAPGGHKNILSLMLSNL